MSENKKSKWHLLAMANSERNIELVSTEKYARVTKDYILVYTISTAKFDKKTQDMVLTYKELSADNLRYLSDSDIVWLLECATDIIRNITDDEEADMLANMSKSLERLEKNLAELSESIQQEGTNAKRQSDSGTEQS